MKRKLWLLAIPAVFCSLAFAAACTQPEEIQVTEYKVVYMNGDEEFDSFTVRSGDALPLPDGTPERADTAEFGYTFAGWTDEENGTAEDIIDLGTVTSVTSDLTYYAVYSATPRTYTVTFVDGLTGDTIVSQEVAYGGDATAPTAPEHEGYRFTGWDGDYTSVDGRTTVTAVYEKISYTLTFDVFGEEDTCELEFGAALDELKAPAAVPVGLTFIEWQAENAEGELVAVEEAYPGGMPAEDITVTAKFAVDWTGVAINSTNAVYGGSASVNLPASAALTFTYKWSDGTTANTYTYKAAGTQQLSVEVTAAYAAGGTTLLSQTKTFTATADVAKAGLDVSVTVTNANGGVLTYGTAPQVTFTATGYVNGDEELAQDSFTATYAFVNDTPADGAKLGVGSYTVSATIDSQNYTANCTPANIRVAAKEIAVNVTANDITYGENADTKVVTDNSQFAYGEDISVLAGGKIVIKNAEGKEVSGILPAGDYTVELSGYTNSNYNVTLGSAEFTVNKATLTATVSVDKTSYVYGEKPVATIEYAGFVNEEGDGVIDQSGLEYTFMSGDKTAEKFNVGEYTVTAGGAAAANYIITEYKPAMFKVTPATLTATVTVDESYVYGTAVQTDIIYSGFVNGENEELVVESGVKFTYNNGEENVTGNLPVGNYTVTAGGATAANYTIEYKGAQFAVTPATITATVNVGASYVFGEQPVVTVDYAGFAYEEDEAVITNKAEITLSGEEVEGYLPVGNYTVTADGAAAANYIFDYVYTNSEFTVTAYGITLGIRVNGVKSGTEWSRTVGNGEVTGLLQGFTFTGKLVLTNTAQGTYTVNGASLENGFAWAEDYKITFNGKDFTNCFALTYSISVSLTDSDFGEVEENTVNTSYTGEEISLGSVTVTNTEEIAGLKIEYKLAKDGEDAWSETAPTAVDAGEYEVEYRITAPNYKTSTDSFTSTITQAKNEITFSGYDTLTYNGETHKFSLEEFKSTFGEVKFAAGSDTEWLNADTYTIKVEVVGTDNYKGDSKEFEVTVNRAANTLTQVSAVENLVFNNTQQNFDISGHFTAANGTPAIVSGDKFGFDADEYTFTVQVAESENYLASNAIQVTVTIAKATDNVISGDGTLEFTYNGTLQNFLEGNEYTATYGTVMFKDQTSGTNAGNYQFTAYVEETANYNGADMLVTVTINKADYSSVPEKVFKDGYDIIYRQNAHTLSDISGALETGFYWVDGTAEFTRGTDNKAEVYYCLDENNYNHYSVGEVTFTAYYEVVITVDSSAAPFEANLGEQNLTREEASGRLVSAKDQDGTDVTVADYLMYIDIDVDSISGVNIGGTYPITYSVKESARAEGCIIKFELGATESPTAFLSENGDEVYVAFKLNSVQIGDKYYTIEEALATATNGQTIIVAGDTSFADSKVNGIYSEYLSNGAYSVAAGVTLLLPYGSGDFVGFNETYVEADVPSNNLTTIGDPYVTLYVNGAKLINNGAITVGAFIGSENSGVGQGYITGRVKSDGAVTVAEYARIDLNGGEIISYGTLSVYGEIIGNGTITAVSGIVRERMEIPDWRGGNAAAATYLKDGTKINATEIVVPGDMEFDEVNEFPFKEYELNGIKSKLVMNSGVTYSGIARIYTNAQDIAGIVKIDAMFTDVDFNLIGYVNGSQAIIRLKDNTTAVKEWLQDGKTLAGGTKENSVKLTISGGADGQGGAEGGYAEIKISVLNKNIKMSTSGVAFPITGTLDVFLKNGVYSSDYGYKLLPGATLSVENATLTLNNKFIIYKNGDIKPAGSEKYTQGRPDGILTIKAGSTLIVNSSFGGIVSGEEGAILQMSSSATNKAQASEGTGSYSIVYLTIFGQVTSIPEAIKFNYTETSPDINNTAQLKNNDGTLTDMVVGSTYTFNGSIWE